MQQELIEEYIKTQIKDIARENNINKDTLLSLKKLTAKCDHFADIIDYYAEMPECSIDGIECCKLFDLWCALDVLKSTEVTEEMLSLLDMLVDGRFVKELKNITLRFRGSENQRIIDLNKTRECGDIVLWEGMNSR